MMTTTANADVTARAFVPELITKELGVVRLGDMRKVRLSTNFLPLMGFETGKRHSVEVLPNLEGLRVAFDSNGPQKVYQRTYKGRKSSPFEAVLEIGGQRVLDAALPSYTERLHFTMRHGEIIIRPLANRTFSIRRNLAKETNPFAAMVAMTSGLDIRCLHDTGFAIQAVLEYRPQEARDSRDLTETGMLTVLANSRPRYVFNEDITTVDWNRVGNIMADGPQIAVLHVSLQCDDYTNLKSRSLKDKSLEDLSTSTDLVFDALRMVETVRPAVVLLEQVPGFGQSAEGNLFRTKLRRWGYEVTEGVFRADQYGGKTRRERMYLVASVFPGFAMPAPMTQPQAPIWNEIEPFLGQCRDVSDSKSLIAGLANGRARLITSESLYSPTLCKSQLRNTKDSVYIQTPDGRHLFPSLELLQYLQGIPQNFDFNSVTVEQCGEQLGQGIDFPLHEAICKAVHAHIAANVGRHTVVSIAREKTSEQVLAPAKESGPQMALFG